MTSGRDGSFYRELRDDLPTSEEETVSLGLTLCQTESILKATSSSIAQAIQGLRRTLEISTSQEPSFSPENPFKVSVEEYGFFKIGLGMLQSLMDSQNLPRGASIRSITKGLQTVFEAIEGSGIKLILIDENDQIREDSQPSFDLDFYRANYGNLCKAYFAFALRFMDFEFNQDSNFPWYLARIYQSAGRVSDFNIRSAEWNFEHKKSFFQYTTITIRQKILARVTLTLNQRIQGEQETSQETFFNTASSLIDSYSHTFLFAYHNRFFKLSDRTLQNGIEDVRQMKFQLIIFHSALINSFYPNAPFQEKVNLVKNSLSRSQEYGSLKACFAVDGTTLVDHWYWSDIFGGRKMDELKAEHPQLFKEIPSNFAGSAA